MTRNGACVVREGGHVACWGPGWGGAAHDIAGVENAEELVSSSPGVCARLSTGAVTCWSARDERFSIEIDDAIDLATADDEICAVRRGGRVTCWGGHFGRDAWRSEYGPDPLPDPEEQVDEEIMEERANRDYEGLSDEVFMEEEDPESPWFGSAIWRHLVQRRDIDDALALAGGRGAWCVLRRAGQVRCWGEVSVPNPEAREPAEGFDLPVEGVLDLTIGGQPAGVCVTLADRGLVCSHPPTAGAVVEPRLEDRGAIPPGWLSVPGAERVERFVPDAPSFASSCWIEDGALVCLEDGAEEPGSFWVTLGWAYDSEGELPPDPFVDPVPVEVRIHRNTVACARYAEGPVRCWEDPDRALDEGPRFAGSSIPEPVPGTD